jgi:tetratricopeptide (TPR) repeat protein
MRIIIKHFCGNIGVVQSKRRCEMKEKPSEELTTRRKAQAEASKVSDEAAGRARKAYLEAKKQAGIVYEKAVKLAVNDQARKEATSVYEEAVKHAEKVRDTIIWEAQVVLTAAWLEKDKDYAEAIAKSKERLDNAKKAYDEAKKRAEIVYEEAKKSVDSKQVKEAAKTYKKAIAQADKDYHEAIKSR